MMKNLILGALALLVVQTLGHAQYSLTVESAPAVGAGGTVYRFYVDMQDATDRMSAVFGNDQASLLINTPAGAFNSTFNSSWNASGINPAFLPVFPDLADDTYATIGLEGPASTSGIAGAADPSIVEDATQAITPYFLTPGATNLTSTTLTGASWYVLNTAANGLPDADLRVLIMQVTTAGDISGQINFQVFPLGVGADQQQLSIEFDGTGTFGAEEPIEGCTDDIACNYNPEANTDDGSCVFVGAGECDCDGNVVDACGICGGDDSSCTGCTSQLACNYDASALVNDPTQCEFAQALCSECSGNADDGTGIVVVYDQDGDGICDDVDTCVGTVDACGVCAGPGAVYDCGCSDIPAGECDCDGNVLDECGVCGGNGIAAGDCDCDGNQLDALGECGGPCDADANGNGICDDAEIPGCMAENACNFDAAATEDDGSCDFCSCAPEARPNVDYPLIVEASPAVGTGGTVYRFYVQMQDATDRMSAVFGNDQASLLIDTPAGAFNSTFNSSWNASGINPAFLGVFPDLADDTYATIGLSGPASTSGLAGAADPSIVEDATQAITPYFLTDGATNLTSTTLTGASWYVLNTAANGLPDGDLRVLILQVTTAGDISGQINYQVFPLGVGADQQQISLEFDGVGTFGDDPETNACGCTDENADNYDADAEYDDGSCVTAGCTNSAACNYNADADTDDGSCAELDCAGVCGGPAVLDDCGICNGPGAIYECGCSDIPAGDCDCDGNVLDECEVCGGNGIPAGDCDCDGNQLDALGECGGPCEADADADGICDDVDNCTDLTACNYNEGNAVCAYLDECEVCGGDGIADGECDCDGNVDDALGVCGGDCASDVNDNGICDTDDIPGCTAVEACNYDPNATLNNGSCDFLSCLVFGCTDPSACNYDMDADFSDGSCTYASFPYDCNNECVNDVDGDGVCDELEIPGCTDATACNYSDLATDDGGNCVYPDAFYNCDGLCVNDADGDGICDELENPGCTDLSACNFEALATDDDGSCLYIDALGVCGGPCEADADMDDICDDVDPCVGELDACNVCNGPGAIFDCGCANIPEGDCDCDGNQLDALGECGGPCEADADADGICDDIDPCVGVLDDCDVCNGPGAIYECGCADIPEGDCDCDGNQLDALGECGGPCEADADADGICDDVDPCVGELDACNVCNGPGAIYECGCADIPAGDCDCNGNVLDECGICGGEGIPAGDCDCNGNQLDALGECGGPCEADADADGICDDVDPCVGELDACDVCNGPGAIYECGCADIPEGDCDCDGNVLDECDVCGGDGIPAGDCDCDGNQLDALGNCGGGCEADENNDGVCDTEIQGCTSELACNYNPSATFDDGSCAAIDECGICGGEGIPSGNCDCNGNQLDALGECGGSCVADADADGICDDVDLCVGELDACGVCNGPGATYECGCSDIPEGDCDCDGNVLDECGICGGDGIPAGDCDCDGNVLDECGICGGEGIPAGDCDCNGNQLDALGECGGSCVADADADGICDDVDPCVGELDACGVCNGPGATYECGCSDIPEGDCDCDGNVLDECGICGGDGIPAGDCDCDGNVLDECGICGGDGIPAGDCDCNGNQLDALGECGGPCVADADADGICDDVDPCVGELDACGVCNGPGATYECGCSDIPEGDCDCDGNVLDECGICGGDGIPAGDCDCDGNVLDECGICGGDGIPTGDCDCNGNQLDALGECGGSCEADADADGICDDVDPCVGELDACGVCNGPGAIYACGCTGIPAGDCDCNGNQLDECFVCGGGSSAGCTDPAACNYDSEAGCDNASCTYIADGDCDCEGNQLDALGECGGPCEADADMDGICDDVDDCVGQLDDCGVCNGPGAIYDCGCSDIPVGDCDCDGNQLDALGECGGPCEADADMDGICDDVDPCVGDLDACGICNGPGAIYDCGCADIPEGDCDCNGNQLDALGECGGTCVADANDNGICDDAEIPGCTDSAACNYNSSATEDDGSCDFCSCGNGESGEGEEGGVTYPLIIESSAAAGDGGTVYRFYVQMQDATDRMSAVFGNDQASFVIDTPEGVFNSTFNSSWNASGINPAFLSVFPDLADDTYATIGLEGPASTSGIVGAADPSIVEDANQAITPYFLTPGATLLESTTLTGASWYILNTAANGLPDANGRVLILQVTTAGSISGQINYQVFPLGVGIDQEQISVEFDGAGTFGTGGGTGNACGCTDSTASNYDGSADYDDGSCEYVVLGCTDENACNYNVDANTDDGSCAVLDCDGVCGGTAVIDDCGICNGPGAIYECGCADIPDGDCDCDGNQLDALGECGGPCEADADADGICDDVDPCVGELDACGVCNGPGAIYECGCDDIPEGDCDCNGNQLDALGECGGPCEADADADGICDDVDECIGELDACGVCNGPGEIYECGCSDIPAGDCDCNGNQEDVIGECGGTCELDNNANGICDDEELTVWDVISSNDSLLNTLDAAILAAGLDSALSVLDTTTAFTVFAPTDTAFAVLLAELGLGAEDLLADTTGLLVNTLLYHVLGEVVLSTDMMDGDSYITLQGDSVLVSVTTDSTGTTIMINDATVIVADVLAANGVVHIIDVVLEQPVFGCMDDMACNYDADATNDDGSCTYPDEDYLDCDGNCLNDADGDGVCDELEVAGCTNLDACNYDELATDDDSSCILIGDACDDGDDNTINDTIDENCECVGEIEDGVEEARLAFGMFPNPTTGEVTLTVTGFHTGVTVQILDGAGRVVWTEPNAVLQGNTVLDLSGLSSGTYNVMLSDERDVSVKRLAIQR